MYFVNFVLIKIAKFGLFGLGIGAFVAGGIYIYNKYKNKKAQDKTNPVIQKQVKPKPVNPKPTETYTVKKGDNLWNIAKQYLIDKHKSEHNYKPTNKEILEKTEELMRLNNKHYEQPLPADSRKRKVLIVPDEVINLN